MADFDITTVSPTECLAALDGVFEALSTREDEQTIPLIQGHLKFVALLSGNVALQEVAQRADKSEMLVSLKEVLAESIVKRAFGL